MLHKKLVHIWFPKEKLVVIDLGKDFFAKFFMPQAIS